MSSQTGLKPIKLYGKVGPNPPKVAFILKELNIPHEVEAVPYADVKKPYYLAVNPNGRLPAIHDPNTDLTLWESGAILEYLIERYDTERKLSFAPGSNEAALARQWLYFQVSGQGPYYGQAVWFKKYHHEQLPSAIERYVNEIRRVTGVLETHLAKQKELYAGTDGFDGPWLVGNKLSYADLAFVPWQQWVDGELSRTGEFNKADYPLVTEWLAKMLARESVKSEIVQS